MINENLYLQAGVRSTSVSFQDFAEIADSLCVIMVRTRDEKDYWLGMQVIVGAKYHVVFEGDEKDWKLANPEFSQFCVYFHVHNPVTKVGTAFIPFKFGDFI